ncbi:elongation factor P [Candidatus Omnitrophota bacterium]
MYLEVGQIKKGFAVELNGNIYYVIERQHVKPGKGGAFIRTKLKNIKAGNVIDKTFRPNEKLEVVYIEKKNIQFLYSSGDMYEFMDHDTYDQISIHKEELGDIINYLKENMEVTALVHNHKIMALEPPIFIDLKIVSTEPGIRGDTSRAGNKPARTETGMSVLVPLFVSTGETIRIDTRTGKYVSRV